MRNTFMIMCLMAGLLACDQSSDPQPTPAPEVEIPANGGEEGCEDVDASILDEVVADDNFAGKKVSDQRVGMQMIFERSKNVPKVGEVAPEFTLKRADGKGTLSLKDLRKDKPVILVFGSFT